MRRLFVGMIFIFLDFQLNCGGKIVGLIPDFIGYIFLFGGFTELAGESQDFSKMHIPSIVMAVYSGALYIAEFFLTYWVLGNVFVPGIHVAITIILEGISLIVSFYISYQVIAGIEEIQSNHICQLNYKYLSPC